MKALIVFDSVFGNTEKIARAMGRALGSGKNVEIHRVENVKPEKLTAADLLIVGSPTRKFKPTPAISGLLGGIPKNGLQGIKVAAFDTRISTSDIKAPVLRVLVNFFGYAARPIAVTLRKKGGEAVLPPEGFFVNGSEGPLKEGELERAATWARRITTS